MITLMKRRDSGAKRGLVAALTAAGLLTHAWADVDPSRYTMIVERNPFQLKPPPLPPDPSSQVPVAPPTPPATVELTGITSIFASKRALLEIIPGPGKPMLKPILSEGEKFESIEVVSINVEKNEVVVKNGPIVTNLTFKVAKSNPTPAPPPPGMGVVPPSVPGAVPPQPGFSYSQPTSGRSGVMMTGGNPAYDPGTANPAASAAPFRSIPSRSIRSGLPQPPGAAQPISAEASVIEIEHNRKMNPPNFPPLPPTVLSPHLTPQLPPLPGQQQQ